MAKVKKISASMFERTVKKNFDNVFTDEWCGLTVSIAPVIDLQEVFNLVNEVVVSCFSEDGQYIPEAMEAVLNCGIVERYTNIALPDDLITRYDLVMKSGIMDFVLPNIDAAQYNQIVAAIRDKIDYICDSNTAAFTSSVNKIMVAVDELKKNTERMLGDFDPEDFRSIIRSLADSTPDEMAAEKYISK